MAEIEILNDSKLSVWVSAKQANKLRSCFDALSEHGGYSCKRSECHVILDEDRFVWCGMHTPERSELKWLEERFHVVCASPYIGKLDISHRCANERLLDDAD